MNKQTADRSPEFQQFLQEVETALLKASAEARRLAQQTGTRFIVSEDFESECTGPATGKTATTRHNGEYPPA